MSNTAPLPPSPPSPPSRPSQLKGKFSNPLIGNWKSRATPPKLVVKAPPPPFEQVPLHDFRPGQQVVISNGSKALANKKQPPPNTKGVVASNFDPVSVHNHGYVAVEYFHRGEVVVNKFLHHHLAYTTINTDTSTNTNTNTDTNTDTSTSTSTNTNTNINTNTNTNTNINTNINTTRTFISSY